MAVRCSIWRSMRSRIWMKARPARRISSAPRGAKSSIFWPLPKLSAAFVSARIGRICPRRNRMAIDSSTSEVPTIQTMKIWVLEA
ncbi:hypothetical protein D3C86_1981440 [compost metagenome]